jgi:FtsZ-binding cell division protein ZapB
MTHEDLLERIKRLDVEIIEEMSPEVMARLTHNFEELLVRHLLYTATTNSEQRKLIKLIKNGYKSWKGDTPIHLGSLSPFIAVPEYMNDLQMDIECGNVITEKGTFSENSARLKVSLIPMGIGSSKPLQKLSSSALQTDEGKKAATNQSGLTDQSYIESLNKQLAELKTENASLKAKNDALENQSELDEARRTIKELREEADHWKDELAAYKERNQNRSGINRLQTAHFGLIVAPLLGINVTNKKELAPMLSKLFGWGKRSMEQQLCNYVSKEDEMEVAKIFGDLSPELAVKFCSDYQGTPEEDTEAPPAD